MNTATIVITETNDLVKIQINYDPLPIKGTPPSEAALVANMMLQMFSDAQDKDAIVSHCIYDSRTGETFTKDASTEQQA